MEEKAPTARRRAVTLRLAAALAALEDRLSRTPATDTSDGSQEECHPQGAEPETEANQ